MVQDNIQVGLRKDFIKITTPSDASDLPGSFELSYLVSTPAVVNMIIEASTELLDILLPADYTTVGTEIHLEHENPTLIGEEVRIRIQVKGVQNGRILLDIEGHDREGRFCKGEHERHIVNKKKLIEHAYNRFSK
ncbi:MAG: hypothetical protein RBR71_05530 [Gudongella sp.]|nr:hypothetical protein [Gudongella sp.]